MASLLLVMVCCVRSPNAARVSYQMQLSATKPIAWVHLENVKYILKLQAVCRRGNLPGTLHGPLSQAVIARVSDQAGRQVGSSWNGSSLKRIQQLCSCENMSQDSTDVKMTTDASHDPAPDDSKMISSL